MPRGEAKLPAMLRYVSLASILAIALLAPSVARAADAMSDSDYTALVMSAAPPAVAKDATIVRMGPSGMQTLRKGTNGFTCMLPAPSAPMCADANAMAWGGALMSHAAAPPDGVGFVYMLAGDNGASNSDPWAMAPTADNHWVKTGPHVMIVGAAVKSMGYPMSLDPDATLPYVMWAQTPYAHLMIPVGTQP